jgi:SAM-dependent methyltransferase
VPCVEPAPSTRHLGRVFDHVAAAYDEARPSYPASLVDAALERGRLGPGSRVLEIGCGTGKLTELLAARGLAVDAIDPGASMIEAARRRVDATDRVRFHLGRFEDLSLGDGSFAAAFSATAFHWLDPALSWRQAARHLEQDGLLALLTYTGVRDERSASASDGFAEMIRKHAPEAAGSVRPSRELETILAGVDQRRDNVSEVWDWIMGGGRHRLAVEGARELFQDVEVAAEVTELEQTADELLAYFRTTSLYFQIDPAHRATIEEADRRMVERLGGTVHVSLATVLLTARKARGAR